MAIKFQVSNKDYIESNRKTTARNSQFEEAAQALFRNGALVIEDSGNVAQQLATYYRKHYKNSVACRKLADGNFGLYVKENTEEVN